jgi:hypothetical protein
MPVGMPLSSPYISQAHGVHEDCCSWLLSWQLRKRPSAGLSTVHQKLEQSGSLITAHISHSHSPSLVGWRRMCISVHEPCMDSSTALFNTALPMIMVREWKKGLTAQCKTTGPISTKLSPVCNKWRFSSARSCRDKFFASALQLQYASLMQTRQVCSAGPDTRGCAREKLCTDLLL